ncbi:hypothetical protein LTR56_013643 [Elasticomyces elasticus]|nr:hypothetical protein LTR22_023724 [Elasticomyces elasticus]KAK3637470.1 hypothetical protein LTR56_013643 [Elasticomyces elasticus]KAK4917871.1 hypothetical protein LTR49_014275 [Elasticomyces elasticus]KAK5757030.1 hypothetical protein LTS12_012844 [Elasticomyces elasticus]
MNHDLPLTDPATSVVTPDKHRSAHNATEPTTSDLVGWTAESPGRGTLSLVITCLTTIALCTWVVIHPRIERRKRIRRWHKLALFIKSFIAPELIAVEAAQEWKQAQQVVKESSKSGSVPISTVQAYYIGMFGIRYRTRHGTKILWPTQFLWLVEQGLLDEELQIQWGLTDEIIHDKGNADATAKLFALLQSAWFVAQSIMRAVHNLPLSPLESMTLGYIPLFAVTYFYWWVKPKDIEVPSEVDLPSMTAEQYITFQNLCISEAFDAENRPEQYSLWQIWYLTPRIFEKVEAEKELEKALQEGDAKQRIYALHFSTCPNRGCADCKRLRPSTYRPKKEVVLSHWDPRLYHSKLWPITCLFGVSFGALHLVSWDTSFPTHVEAWLWRAAAITSMVTLFTFMQFEKVVVRWQDPLMLVKIVSPFLYLVSRLIMLGGAIAAFRACDPAIYETYVVSTYWVHLL